MYEKNQLDGNQLVKLGQIRILIYNGALSYNG